MKKYKIGFPVLIKNKIVDDAIIEVLDDSNIITSIISEKNKSIYKEGLDTIVGMNAYNCFIPIEPTDDMPNCLTIGYIEITDSVYGYDYNVAKVKNLNKPLIKITELSDGDVFIDEKRYFIGDLSINKIGNILDIFKDITNVSGKSLISNYDNIKIKNIVNSNTKYYRKIILNNPL